MRVIGIFDVFTGDSAKDAAAKNAQLYQQYSQQGTQALDSGLTNSVGSYAPLQALGQKYGGATDMYFNSLGLNGQAGNDAARGAFQAGPGYQWQVQQATDAAARNGAKLGMANSGNTLAEIGNRAGQLANQQWGNWQGQLGGLSNTGAGIVGNTAAGLAGLYGTDAQNRVNLYGNVAGGQANSNTSAANSEMAGSANFWNGLMSAAGNVAKGG